MDVEKKAITIKEFEAIAARPENSDKLLELINGEIVEKVVTQEHGMIAVNISAAIKAYLQQNRIGRVAVEANHRPVEDDMNERLPDISVTLDLENPVVKAGAILYMPDLAIEIKSPSNTYKEMREKARFYLANGSRMVWLVFPEKRLVEIYTSTEELIASGNESVSGGEVLPGFALSLDAIFDY